MQSRPKLPLTLTEDVRRSSIQREAQDVFNTSITDSQSWCYVHSGNAVGFGAEVRSHSRQEIHQRRMQAISIFLSSN